MARVKSGTLTADTVATVPITNHGGAVEVVNRTQTGTIWVRTDGTNPTVAGDDCHPVLGARRFIVATLPGDTASIKLISADALDYTVEAGG